MVVPGFLVQGGDFTSLFVAVMVDGSLSLANHSGSKSSALMRRNFSSLGWTTSFEVTRLETEGAPNIPKLLESQTKSPRNHQRSIAKHSTELLGAKVHTQPQPVPWPHWCPRHPPPSPWSKPVQNYEVSGDWQRGWLPWP